MNMEGIDLNCPVEYIHSSLRFFNPGECHISRFCGDDVLLLVFEGVLRFTEAGVSYALHPGEYHIQKHDTIQDGPIPSDVPRYLYVHFRGSWTSVGDAVLPRSGVFDCGALRPMMEEMDTLAHNNAPHVEKLGKFCQLLSSLRNTAPRDTLAERIAAWMQREYSRPFRLDELCSVFHFSRNHIIGVFKKEFGVTPVAYLNRLRLQKAAHLMEVTSESLERIAVSCGFPCYSHFYRQFLKHYGCPPEIWRKKRRLG